MTRSTPIKLFASAAVAAMVAAPFGVVPAQARDGVSVTIHKGPTYLNTRTTPRAGSYSRAAFQTNAATQSTTPTRGIGFDRWPLPSTFTVSGY